MHAAGATCWIAGVTAAAGFTGVTKMMMMVLGWDHVDQQPER